MICVKRYYKPITLQYYTADCTSWVPSTSLVAQGNKESSGTAGDLVSIPGLGRSPGEGKGYSLQYSCLRNTMDSHRSLVDYSPWGRNSDTAERLTL